MPTSPCEKMTGTCTRSGARLAVTWREGKISLVHLWLVVVLLLLMILWVGNVLLRPGIASAAEPTATASATVTPSSTLAPPKFFSSQIQVRPLSTPVGPIQDVQGKVVTKAGVGINGISVRAFSRDWQAFDTTRDGGKFSFSLTFGSYTIQLVDMLAGEAALTVDGKNDLQVQFNEVDRILVTPSATRAATSPTATVTATESPTPSATLIPTATPIPLPDTIVVAPPPEVTPSPGSSFFSILPEFDPGPLFEVFIYGLVIGGAMVVAGLLITFLRRS